MNRIILLIFLLFNLSIVYGQGHKQRANSAIYMYDNGDYGHVTVQFEYQFNGTQFKINIYNVLVEGSSKMATKEPQLLAALKRDNVFGKAQGWLKSVSIKYKANVAFGHPFIRLNIPISGLAYGNRTEYTFFEPTAELRAHNSEYFKQHNKNFYDETASIQASTFRITELSFPALTEEINKYRRNLKAAKEKEAQEKKDKELVEKKKQEEQKQLEEKKKKEETEQVAKEQAEQKKQESEAKQLAEKEDTKREEEQKNQAGFEQEQRTNNETIKETQIDIVEVAKAYNANEKAKSDALTNAGNQTFDQWAQGNYIQGAKPLVDEFARQGNATGMYGTMGVAAGAQILSFFAEARAARKERVAAREAYNYELNQGLGAYEAGKYEEAFSWFYNSYQQNKHVRHAKLRMGLQLLYGKGVVKNEVRGIEALEEYIANKKIKDLTTDYGYVTSFLPDGKLIVIYFHADATSFYSVTFTEGKLITIGLIRNNLPEGEWKYYHNNGQLKLEVPYVNGVLNGEVKKYHENGQLEERSFFVNGKPEGEVKKYRENGQLEQLTFFVNGKAEGEVKKYHQNGQLELEMPHVNGVLNGEFKKYHQNGQLEQLIFFVNGKAEGELKEYHQNGQLKQLTFFVNGVLNGEAKYYYNNGQLKEILFFVNGVLNGEFKEYHENGQLKEISFFVNGKPEGEVKEYYENGQLKEISFFVNGKPEGEAKSFHSNGQLELEALFVNGVLNGEFKKYHQNGQLEQLTFFVNGEPEGEVKFYHTNGQPKEISFRVNGKTEGEWKYFDESGKLVQTQIYKKGKLKKTLKH